MSKLFQVIPCNLFSILSSKNKEIYTDALFVLRKAFKQEMSINKSDLVAMLLENLDQRMMELDLSTDEIDEDKFHEEINETTLSGIAHFIMRRLKETGWIEIEYQVESFEEYVTLPDYSIKLINLLFSFTEDRLEEYNSHVYSTYSLLKTADLERSDYLHNALITAYNHTIQLMDDLKTLHSNIRRYHQALNEYVTVNDVLKGHFDEYRNLVGDRVYHRLKTLDSVPRYKDPIIAILKRWMLDTSFRQEMEKQAINLGKYQTAEEAEQDIILKIGEIIDIYERIDLLLYEIDKKNSAYTQASIEKARYLLNTDKSIKGKIVDLLTMITRDEVKEEELLFKQIGESLELTRQRFLDEDSLYKQPMKQRKNEGQPMKIQKMKEEEAEQSMEQFIELARKTISHKKIIAYVQSAMGMKNSVTSGDMPLPDDESFVLLILATIKGGGKNVFYDVNFLNDYLDNNGYKIPLMRFIKKGKDGHVD